MVGLLWVRTHPELDCLQRRNFCPLPKSKPHPGSPRLTRQTLDFFIVPLLHVGKLNKSHFSASHYHLSPYLLNQKSGFKSRLLEPPELSLALITLVILATCHIILIKVYDTMLL